MPPSSSDDALIARLLDLPAADRAGFWRSACVDDPTLRTRHPEFTRLFAPAETSAVPGPPASSSASPFSGEAIAGLLESALGAADREAPGTRVGHYKLLQKIGEGGFGAVWMAEQLEPIRRRVALKILKVGMDTDEVIARFEAERQALALMDHPNIARVFDAGATPAGRPFFVMELVRGVAITRYCDDHRVTAEARLRLFTSVCQAVQHAHQKGVIHRDLKPSNILVTVHDGTPVPKVIDFGIAKATDKQLTEKTLITHFHAFVGTPAYTSPEQMEMSGLDVDTRSDIYSLGVLLYELLAGRPPFDPDALMKAGLEAMRRTIREIDPPRPSHRLGTLADADRTTIASQRGTDVTKLSLLLRGDLDWIVMHCLEKDRTRRYETASALAQDVERHLANEPVVARPPSTLYRAQKTFRRHKFAALAGLAIVLSLVGGLALSTFFLFRERATRKRAVAAELSAVEEHRRALDERQRAETMLGLIFDDLYKELSKANRPDLQERITNRAMAYFNSHKPQDLSDTSSLDGTKALSLIGRGHLDNSRLPEAEQAFSQAYARAEPLAAARPKDGEVLFERAQIEYWLGLIARRRGDSQTAAAWFKRYRDTAAALVALDPTQSRWQRELVSGEHNLAVLNLHRDELVDSRSGFLAALNGLEKLRAANPSDVESNAAIASIHSLLGSIAERAGNYPEALDEFIESVKSYEQLVRTDPGNPQWKIRQATSLVFQANLLAAIGRRTESRTRLAEAHTLLGPPPAADFANRTWWFASLYNQVKDATLSWAERRDVVVLEQVLAIRTQLERFYSDQLFDIEFAMATRLEAELLFELGRPDARLRAVQALSRGEAVLSSKGPSTIPSVTGECAQTALLLGNITLAQGDVRAAQGYRRRALALVEPKLATTNDWQLLDPAVRAYAALGKIDQARPLAARLKRLGYVPLTPFPEGL